MSENSKAMMETSSAVNNSNASDGKGIIVNGELLKKLRSVLAKGLGPYDRLPSDRELLDFIVPSVLPAFSTLVYSHVGFSKEKGYRYFGSEVVTSLRRNEEIRDLGRLVDACIIAYLYGEAGLQKWCTGGKVVYPKKLDQEKLTRIRKCTAEMADSKSSESEFIPCSIMPQE